MKVILTPFTPFHFICDRRKDIKDLGCNLHHLKLHLQGQRDRIINLEPDEEAFNAPEDVDENALALGNISSHLKGLDSSRAFTR